MKKAISIFIVLSIVISLLTGIPVFAESGPRLEDITIIEPNDTGLDNGASTAIMPSLLNPNINYEYGFATINGGEPYNGEFGKWFDINAAGVGTWTKGLINSHVAIPLTYYHKIKAQDMWLVIRDKANPDVKKYIQVIPDNSTLSLSERYTAATAISISVDINSVVMDAFELGVPGALSFGNNGSPVITGKIPVGVPFAYIIAPNGPVPDVNDPRWSTTILHYTTATKKVTMPDYLMRPQDPNGNQIYIKYLTSNSLALNVHNPNWYLSGRPPVKLGDTTTLMPSKFSMPAVPSYITAAGTVSDKVTLNNLLPHKYEYVLSDNATAPTDWSYTNAFQSSTGSVDITSGGELYAYIRTLGGTMMAESGVTKLSLPNAVPPIPLTNATVLRGTIANGVVTINIGEKSVAVRPNVSYKNWTYTVNGLAGTKFYSATAKDYFAVVKAGEQIVITVKVSGVITNRYSATIVASDPPPPAAVITGLSVRRGTVAAGTNGANYNITINPSDASMAFTPITNGKLVSITPTEKLYYGGDAYYAVVKPTDVGTIYTVTVKNIDNVVTICKVQLVTNAVAANLGSVDIRRGTVSSIVGNVINVVIDAGQKSTAVSLIGVDPACRFTVANALRSYGGNGLYYAVINRSSVVAAGGTLDINCTLTLTSTGVSRNYIIRATLV